MILCMQTMLVKLMSEEELLDQLDSMVKKRETDPSKINKMIDETLRLIMEEILHDES
jgi:hypothetical protein